MFNWCHGDKIYKGEIGIDKDCSNSDIGSKIVLSMYLVIYLKFKNLLFAEKDATLTLKSEAGRAYITLSLDLGHVLSGEDHLPPRKYKMGLLDREGKKNMPLHI